MVKVRVTGKENNILIGNGVVLKKTSIRICGSQNSVFINDNVRFYEEVNLLIEGDNCTISIGENTTIGSGNIFCGESDTKITIGDDCMLSRKVYLNTSDFHSIVSISDNCRINPPKDILISNHVWIGYNTTINKGAIINSNSIIASRSVVSGKEYPEYTIIAGIPAKIIKQDINWDRKKLSF